MEFLQYTGKRLSSDALIDSISILNPDLVVVYRVC